VHQDDDLRSAEAQLVIMVPVPTDQKVVPPRCPRTARNSPQRPPATEQITAQGLVRRGSALKATDS
jgi:hypothetical protein